MTQDIHDELGLVFIRNAQNHPTIALRLTAHTGVPLLFGDPPSGEFVEAQHGDLIGLAGEDAVTRVELSRYMFGRRVVTRLSETTRLRDLIDRKHT